MKLKAARCCEITLRAAMFWVHCESNCQPVCSGSAGYDATWLILASLYASTWTEQWLLFRSCSIFENPRRFIVSTRRRMPTTLKTSNLSSFISVLFYGVQYRTILSADILLNYRQRIDVLICALDVRWKPNWRWKQTHWRRGLWGCSWHHLHKLFHLFKICIVWLKRTNKRSNVAAHTHTVPHSPPHPCRLLLGFKRWK